jgi:hypothetical protein
MWEAVVNTGMYVAVFEPELSGTKEVLLDINII